MSLFEELRRRNVFRVAAAYIVSAWLIIQVAETILPQFGLEHWVRPVIVILAVGFVPAVVLAWALEWTPEGIRVEADADHVKPAAAKSSKRFDRIIIAILTVALVYFVYDKLAPSPPAATYSIAVLPFDNETPDETPDYLSDGVAGELLELLGKIPEIRVISRSSAFSFKGQNIGIPEIGERLNVSHILRGALGLAGNKIRVTAALHDARSGGELWSRTYARSLGEIFAIQDEITSEVVQKLQVKMSGTLPTARRTDPEALALTLQARKLFYDMAVGTYSGDGIEKMTTLLEEALEIDPQYAPAMAWMVYANWSRLQAGLISADEESRLFIDIAGRALAVDPENAMIHQLLGWGAIFEKRDLEAAASSYDRALRSGPNNAEVLRHVGRFAYIIGRFDDAVQILERSIELDPLCSMCIYHASRGFMVAGRLDKAEEIRRRFVTLYGQGLYFYGVIKLLQGEPTAALEIFQDLDKKMSEAGEYNDGRSHVALAMVYHDLGRYEESDAQLATFIDRWGDDYPVDVARAHAWRNEKDKAFEWLDRIEESYWLTAENPVIGASRVVDPQFRNLHDDPRWEKFREREGLSRERIEALQFTNSLPR